MLLASDVSGEGPCVVLLHAGVGDRRLWDDQWSMLSEQWRVVRCDFRGFGETPPGRVPYSNGADVLELLDDAAVDRALVVGGSLGGRVALEIAVDQPERVTGLVLVSPSLPGHDWSEEVRAFGDEEDEALGLGDVEAAVELNLRMWFDGPHRGPAPALAARRAAVGEMQRKAFQVQLFAPNRREEDPLVEDLRARLIEIAVPTCVLVGQHDAHDFHAIGAHLAATLPFARLGVLAGTAHLPNFECPDAFNPVLVDALHLLTG